MNSAEALRVIARAAGLPDDAEIIRGTLHMRRGEWPTLSVDIRITDPQAIARAIERIEPVVALQVEP